MRKILREKGRHSRDLSPKSKSKRTGERRPRLSTERAHEAEAWGTGNMQIQRRKDN